MELEIKDGKDMLPLWECPYCKGQLEEVDKEQCSSLDIYKECSKCRRIFKEVWVIKSITEEK